MAGLDATGLTIETTAEIREGMNDQMRDAFNPDIDLSDGTIEGVVIGIVAERLGDLNELAEVVYNSTDPDSATGTAQDAICALTGTQREAATNSKVTLTLTGTNGTLVTTGSQASTVSTETLFETLEDATLATATSWVTATAYSTLGTIRKHAGGIYYLIGAGTSGATGPVGTDPTNLDGEVDGTCVWRFLGAGAAFATASAQAVATGPLVAVASAITNIETPVSGWSAVVNVLDATPGSNIESNEDLRIRREVELASPGSSPIDALYVELRDVTDVSSVTIFANNSNVTDADGVPANSVEALVQGGADQDIFDRLLASVAIGIGTYGTEVGAAVDSAGNSHVIKFSRPDELEIYVSISIVKESGIYPEDGDDQVKAAIVAYGDVQRTGKDAVANSILAQALTKVAGVLDVTFCYISTSPSPTLSTTITVSPRQLAVFDTSRIDVISVDGTP